MSQIQKIAWVFVVSTSAALIVSLATVGILYYYAGMPKALAGFSFMGIAGLGGLAPLLIRKDAGPVAVDERDKQIEKNANLAGFGAVYLFIILVSFAPIAILGEKASIPVTWLPGLLVGAGLCQAYAFFVAILVQYGRGTKDEQ